LGGLLTSDREEWMVDYKADKTQSSSAAKSAPAKSAAAKVGAKKVASKPVSKKATKPSKKK
jgi:hypothetical protein